MVFATLLATLVLTNMVLEPSHMIIGLDGDSIKNFYTYLYHTLYDNNLWFTGMNYPYGEHAIYTDGMPALSTFVIWMRDTFHLQHDTIVAAFYVTLALGYGLGIFYVYKLFVHFGVKPWWAIAFAGLVIILSPQQTRLVGHFGLGMLCVIPMLWYWLARYDSTAHWRYAVYVAVFGFVIAFIHPYLLAVSFLFAGAYILTCFFYGKRTFRERLLFICPLALALIIAFAGVKGVLYATDPVKDRPTHPWGLLEYCTKMEDLTASPLSPIWRPDVSISEGFAYVGVVTMAVVAVSLLITAVMLVQRKKVENMHTGMSSKWLLIAGIALLIASGAPIEWMGGELPPYLSAFRQFRTLGRFAWICYYIITVYTGVCLYRWFAALLQRNRRVAAYGMLLLAVLLWVFDASGYVNFLRHLTGQRSRQQYMQYFYWDRGDPLTMLEKSGYTPDSFQAIISLPFMYIGTDKLWLHEDGDRALAQATGISVNTGLPMVNAMLARTSWQQGFKHAKLIAGPFVHKPLLDDIQSDKPFLISYFTENEMDEDSRYLLRMADSIGWVDGCKIYKLYPARLRHEDERCIDSALAIAADITARDSCIACTAPFFIVHYDEKEYGKAFWGRGAETHMYKSEDTLVAFDMQPMVNESRYEFSIWVLVNDVDYRSPAFHLKLYDTAGNMLKEEYIPAKISTDNHGMWLRVSKYFSMPAGTRRMVCQVDNNPDKPDYIAIDELLIRPADALMISKNGNAVLANNHLLKKQ